MSEIWLPVVGYETLYEVSSFGRVKSLQRKIWGGSSFYFSKEKILKNRPDKYGRDRAHLCVDAKHKDVFVHTLVATAFIGPKPEGMQCCHNDGNNKNNRLENLRWDTPKNNQNDRYKHGTDNSCERSPLHKLSLEDVKKIRADHRPQMKIAEEFGIVQQHISRIKAGIRWSHIW